jgi:hypothetical protein
MHIKFGRELVEHPEPLSIPRLSQRISKEHIYQYKLTPSNLSVCLTACRESRGEALKLFPDTLKFLGRPTIHFNKENDTVMFDAVSLYDLYVYFQKCGDGPLDHLTAFWKDT